MINMRPRVSIVVLGILIVIQLDLLSVKARLGAHPLLLNGKLFL